MTTTNNNIINNNNDDDDISMCESNDDSTICGSIDEKSKNQNRKGRGREEEELVIAKDETKAVRGLRLLVLAVLILSAVAVAVPIYFYTSNSEQVQFEIAFQGHSHKVLEGIGTSLERDLGALDTLQNHLVSWAKATNQTWPFVTTPDFAVRASKIRLMSSLNYVSVNPLVTKEQRLAWETYSLEQQAWVNESMKVQAKDEFYYGPIIYNSSIYGVVHGDYGDVPYNASRMLPSWQASPVVSRYPPFNWDYLGMVNPEAIIKSLETEQVLMSKTYGLPDMNNPDEVAQFEAWADWLRDFIPPDANPGEPLNDIYYPIVDYDLGSVRLEDPTKVVGIVSSCFYWRDLIKDLLPAGSDGIVAVFSSTCSPDFTYQIDGPNTTFLGRGDLHQPQFDRMVVQSDLHQLGNFFIRKSQYTGIPLDHDFCPITIKVYPSITMQVTYITNNPTWIAVGAVLIFVFTSAVFLLYDFMVERRQEKVMTTAVRTNAIVSSLFPSVVRDRIYPTAAATNTATANGKRNDRMDQEQVGGSNAKADKSSPVAELFPEATVFFADIAGFTAWSSVREPTQVFTLLESLYSAFDFIARQRGVFKVETIGDCYVAVCGLPEPCADHAVVMVKFARDCRDQLNRLTTRKLQKTLGPDTRDLRLRIGLHSGPVTAGVLRGDRSRFQLFGDTVNCASRMESNGKPNMIQVSQKTADLLIDAGKGHWLRKREELIQAKGKGMMQTYWVDPPRRGNDAMSEVSSCDSDINALIDDPEQAPLNDAAMAEKLNALVEWNYDTLEKLATKIVARRVAVGGEQQPIGVEVGDLEPMAPRAEVTEMIILPDSKHSSSIRKEPVQVALSSAVQSQLRNYITSIAYSHRSNAFHNFEHSSHVAMSIMKLLQRVSSREASNPTPVEELPMWNLYFVTSDPLTQFALVYSALIQSLDHPGVSNEQLVAERDPLALLYNNRSVAEQNSVSIAWQLLMEPSYSDLRACLFGNDINELARFRQLVVNSVIATDFFDQDLNTMRQARWEELFHHKNHSSESVLPSSADELSRQQATLVLEYLMQAAAVAHTMQHWSIFQKWSKRLFKETYDAFLSGRFSVNPVSGWHQRELLFFDNYVIPLASKLKECRALLSGSGVSFSYDELLDSALDNRREWEANGQAFVEELVHQRELAEI